MKLFVEKYYNKEGVKKLADKSQDELTVIESTLELSVLLRCIYVFVYYHTKDFGLSPSLMILIHMIYQARI